MSDSKTHNFAPFIPENLGREWKIAFGNWAVEDGRLTHVLPSGPDPTGSMMISGGGMGEVDVLSHLGGITFSFPDGGVETVELQLDMSLQRAEPASVSLDEWGIEWGPCYAITLKNMDQSPGYLDEAIAHADAYGVETMLCPYLNCVFSASDSWADQLREVIRGVTARGIHGLVLYESASFVQADGHGDIKCMLPGMKNVLSDA